MRDASMACASEGACHGNDVIIEVEQAAWSWPWRCRACSAAPRLRETLTLPGIDVYTRIRTGTVRGPASTVTTPDAPPAADAPSGPASGIGIPGASTTVITAEEIARSPTPASQDI